MKGMHFSTKNAHLLNANLHLRTKMMMIFIMLSVVMLSVVMLSVVMLSVVMLSVVMLSIVMLSVVAPPHKLNTCAGPSDKHKNIFFFVTDGEE